MAFCLKLRLQCHKATMAEHIEQTPTDLMKSVREGQDEFGWSLCKNFPVLTTPTSPLKGQLGSVHVAVIKTNYRSWLTQWSDEWWCNVVNVQTASVSSKLFFLLRCVSVNVWWWHGAPVPACDWRRQEADQHHALATQLPWASRALPALEAGTLHSELLLRAPLLWDGLERCRGPCRRDVRGDPTAEQPKWGVPHRQQCLLVCWVEWAWFLGLARRRGNPPEHPKSHKTGRVRGFRVWHGDVLQRERRSRRRDGASASVWDGAERAALRCCVPPKEGERCGAGGTWRGTSTQEPLTSMFSTVIHII